MQNQRRQFLKTSILGGIGLFTGSLFLGCNSRTIQSSLVNIPGNQIITYGEGDKIVIYGLAPARGAQLNRISMFTIHVLADQKVKIDKGTDYSLDEKEYKPSEFKKILTIIKSEFMVDSVESLVKKYNFSKPIVPDSSFAALPHGSGKNLYNVVKKACMGHTKDSQSNSNRSGSNSNIGGSGDSGGGI